MICRHVAAVPATPVKLPSDINVPLFIKDDFPTFYKSMFDMAVERESMRSNRPADAGAISA
jgi:hypothetical protein